MGYYKKLATERPKRGRPTTKTVKSPKKIVEYKIEGLPEVTKALNSFEPKVRRKYISRAARATAKVVLAAAKRLVPVKTGALLKSLRVRSYRKNRKNRGSIGSAVTTGQGFFRGDTYYGGFLEFGTEHIKERRYLRGAAEETEDDARQIFKRAVQDAVESHGSGGK